MNSFPNLTRREFLVHSASIAGASLGLQRTRSLAAGADTDVRLGYVGLGGRGRQLLGAALSVERARVVALCDVNPKALKGALELARDHKPRGFTDYRALLEWPELDAVVIATPVFLHHPQTLEALAAGKHVFCEKPMALHPSECHELLTACRDAEARGQIYQAGFQRRYNPRYRRSIEFLHQGDAGDVLFVRAQWHAVSAARKNKPWLFRREKSGDIVLEQACHQFDVFNWVFRSTPLHAAAMGGSHRGRHFPGMNTLDHYGALLEYPGGGKVHLSHLTYSIAERRFSGIYELAFCERTGVDLANALTWDGSGQTRELCTERGSDTRRAVAAFVDCLLRGERPEANAEVAYEATLTALLCRKAIDSERRVAFTEIEPA
ncbi:MAG: Gfo/Idh/MocA family oxidoreductase [Planctomycetota bacterium]|nr:Gfo/Idh/MocA family oxidoreductase [Planctomycetota bacterium]